MKKAAAVSAIIGIAALVGGASADVNSLGVVQVPRGTIKTAQPTKGIVSRQTINYRTGERYPGLAGSRAATLVFDNTVENSGFGYGDFEGILLGDFHALQADGVLDTISFSVLNTSGSEDQVLESVDVNVDFLDTLFESLGNFDVLGIVFDPPLAPGEAGLVDVVDLAELNLALPPNVITSFSYTNMTGGADSAGHIWFDDPPVGWSAGNAFVDFDWPDFEDGEGNVLYSDIYLALGVLEPGDLVALANTGATRVVLSGETPFYIGYISGYLDETAPQRWAAIPFTLENDSTITEIDGWWFENVFGTEVRYRIWNRTELERPTSDDDIVVDRFLRPDDIGEEPRTWFYHTTLEEVLELPAGDYYITLYCNGDTPPFSIAWFGGGESQREELERDFMWRARMFPDPGFLEYNAGGTILAPAAMEDDDDLWNLCFTLRGTAAAAPCQGIVCGDSNGDGSVDFNDIDCFVQALIGQEAWANCGTAYAEEDYVCANDINGDGSVDFNDIDGFVSALINGECP
jgi:hypothetical protein